MVIQAFCPAQTSVWVDRKVARNPLLHIASAVTNKPKKNGTADNLLLKDRKRKTDIMNNQRTKQHICKPHKPTHDRSLQKSCFLADAPPKFDTFVIKNFDDENIY